MDLLFLTFLQTQLPRPVFLSLRIAIYSEVSAFTTIFLMRNVMTFVLRSLKLGRVVYRRWTCTGKEKGCSMQTMQAEDLESFPSPDWHIFLSLMTMAVQSCVLPTSGAEDLRCEPSPQGDVTGSTIHEAHPQPKDASSTGESSSSGNRPPEITSFVDTYILQGMEKELRRSRAEEFRLPMEVEMASTHNGDQQGYRDQESSSGDQDCSFLASYEHMDFARTFVHPRLMLGPKPDGLHMNFTFIQRLWPPMNFQT